MTEFPEKVLAQARDLTEQAKLDEALEIIEKLEKVESLSPKDQLSVLLLKGKIYSYYHQFEKQVKISELAFQISQNLGLAYESVEALMGKASILFIGDLDTANAYLMDAERRWMFLADNSSKKVLKGRLNFLKSFMLLLKGNLKGAAELAQMILKQIKEEKIGNNLDLARTYYTLGWIINSLGNQSKAIKYASKSLEINKEQNLNVAIAADYSLIARIYRFNGDYDKALQYCKQSLSIKELANREKLIVLQTTAQIYYMKSELRRALKYQEQTIILAEELNTTDLLIQNLIYLGKVYRTTGELSLAIECAERSLILTEKWGFIAYIARSLSLLIRIYIEEGSRTRANRYFSRLTDLYNQTEEKGEIDISSWYLGSKAYMMKTSTRMSDRVDAQKLYKELINHASGNFLISCISNLCDLLLEELSLYNDVRILDEITPLITRSLEMAETAHNYYWLTETKLLQAKLALIQMNIEDAKKLMVQAQRIADFRGLNRLASKISSEHDKLLEQVDVWDTIRKEGAPISDRIKLASTSGILERIQGKHAIESHEPVNEEPILLIIMDKSGTTYFNHPFVTNWDHSDLFSSFMSAFNTFMDEIFSKSIDRIRVGENTILINPIESFLACYVIKGQSYPALQKLTRFTEAIRENQEIWDALNKSVKTSEMLGFDKPPALKTVIEEIFNQ